MPTLDDLRTALFSLEDEAPANEDLLSRASASGDRDQLRRRRPWVPAIATVAAVVLAVAGVHQLNLNGRSPDVSGTPRNTAAGGHGRLLPFHLTSPLPQLALLTAQSRTAPSAASGTAVVAEYGMEVTIHVSAAESTTHSPAASPVAIAGVTGWIDTSCGVQGAPSSPALTINSTCALSFDSGPWHIAIYVAGPGGGSRKIVPQQFLEIADLLQLAKSISDPTTWFDSDTLLPR